MAPFARTSVLATLTSSRHLLFIIDSVVVVFLASTLRQLKQKSQEALAQELAARKRSTENERRFRSLFEANMIGLFFTKKSGRIFEANDYFLNLVGYDRHDLAGKGLNWRELTPWDHIDSCENIFRTIEKQGTTQPFEKDYLHRDGTRIRVLVGIADLQEGTYAVFVLDNRERKRIEEELERRVEQRTQQLGQSERFLESVVENLPNMLFVKDAKSLRFVRLNRAGEELLGYRRETLLGRNDYDFFPQQQADSFAAADRRVLEAKVAVDIPEEVILTKSGPRFLHTKKIPILGSDGNPLYLLGISEDITVKKAIEQQRQAQAEAESKTHQLRFLAEASKILSESLDIKRTLRAFADLLVVEFADWCEIVLISQSDDTLAENHIVAFRRSEDAPLADEVKKYPPKLEPTTAEFGRIVATAAPAVYTQVTDELIDRLVSDPARRESIKKLKLQSIINAPIQAYGKVLGVLSVAIADNDRKSLGEIDGALVQELGKRVAFALENSRLFRKAQEANRAKSAFLANMSHEVRTPLGAMLGFADLLASENLKEEQMKYVQTVLRNGRQLLRIVDEILDLSKVESDLVAIEKIEFSLRTLISEVMALLEMQAREKNLEFKLKLSPDLPDRVISDPTRLRQILINVIGNAIKFTTEGYIEVCGECRNHPENPSSWIVEFKVTDTGIGIDASQAEKLFQPFVQADNSMTRRFGGTGLGLFVSRKLARLLGGDVLLTKSNLGRGTQFTITAAMGAAKANRPRESNDSRHSHKEIKSHAKVLVVDDAPDNRTLIHHYLSRLGTKADLAGTGVEAINLALKGDYDLILMDVQMPEMDGLEAVRQLRAHHYQKPIVALTAHAMKGDREQCLRAGFDDYLGKPIDRDRLRQTIERYTEELHS